VASLLWLGILLGPPLALTLLAPMLYADGATRDAGMMPVKTDNRAALLVLIASFAGWLMLLKYLYLPAIHFETNFLTFTGLVHYDYTDLKTLGALWDKALAYLQAYPLPALAMLAIVPVVDAIVLTVARQMGHAASLRPSHSQRWFS